MIPKVAYYNLTSEYFEEINSGEPFINFPGGYPREFDFLSEKPCSDNWNPRIFAFALGNWNRKKYSDFPVIAGEHRGASIRVRKLLESHFPGLIEFLPFRVRTTIGTVIDVEYSLLHLLKCAVAVDRKNSVLLPRQTSFSRPTRQDDCLLEKVVINSRKLVEPICRVSGWSPYYLFREDVVQMLTDEGLVPQRHRLFELVELC